MAESFAPPEMAFTSILERGSSRRFKGIIVDAQASKVTITISGSPLLSGMTDQDFHQVGDCTVLFVQVDRSAASKLRPDDWANNTISKLQPWRESFARVMNVYNDLDAEMTAASSNERTSAAAPASQAGADHFEPNGARPSQRLGRPSGSQAPSGAQDLLSNAARRFGVAPDSESEEDEDEGGAGIDSWPLNLSADTCHLADFLPNWNHRPVCARPLPRTRSQR